MSTSSAEFQRILGALAGVQRAKGRDYTSFSVRGRRFGYYWPRTRTVGLKQLLSELVYEAWRLSAPDELVAEVPFPW